MPQKTNPPTPKRRRPSATRTDVVTVRLDPHLRYAVELAAAQTRNSVSSMIEWAVDRLCKESILIPPTKPGETGRSAADVAVEVWEPDPVNRLARLATRYPQLMTLAERRLWRLIHEDEGLWKKKGDRSENNLITRHVREQWEDLRHRAEYGFSVDDPDYIAS